MKKLLPLILLLVVVGVVGFVFVNSQKNAISKTHVVTLFEEGFTSNTITIKKGDTVEFKTTLGKPFWPASNLHPTHGIFPEFDPKREIAPNETWSFTFKKAGQWGFHDHLNSAFTGKIVVEK